MKKNYYVEMFAVGKKETSGFDGFDKSVAHFTTDAVHPSVEFEKAMKQAIDKRWNQEKRWWKDYRLGKVMVETGREPVSVMSPAWEYHKGRTFPVYEEVDTSVIHRSGQSFSESGYSNFC